MGVMKIYESIQENEGDVEISASKSLTKCSSLMLYFPHQVNNFYMNNIYLHMP